jgi:dihydropteroate synthase-like protein
MPRCLFVTGRLAAQSLKATLQAMSSNIEYELAVLPISVAALLDIRFVAKHLADASGCQTVMVPGLCSGDLDVLAQKLKVEVIRGPKNLKDLPAFLGVSTPLKDYGGYQTKILAEIVDAYKISTEEILSRASYFSSSGADIIDLGCPVEGSFRDVDKPIQALKAAGFQVSIDSFNEEDMVKADRAGVDLILSVNSKNIDLARSVHCKVVVIPDSQQETESLERNIARLEAWNIPYIIDPILNPIGFGFTKSIENFITVRRNHPQAEMLMGLGNVTELTDADSTGINAIMAGIVAELRINYVLTTEVVSWARGAVRELDLARRLMHYACENKVLPKNLNDGLITVKDPPFQFFDEKELRAMQERVRDRNYRIFTDSNYIYVFNNHVFVKEADIEAIYDRLEVENSSEAFYLGRELQKAQLALKLGKKYIQEEELRWGYLLP